MSILHQSGEDTSSLFDCSCSTLNQYSCTTLVTSRRLCRLSCRACALTSSGRVLKLEETPGSHLSPRDNSTHITYLFNIFTATLHICRPSSLSTTWGRAMPQWQYTHTVQPEDGPCRGVSIHITNLFNIFTTTLHIWSLISSIHNLSVHHAVVTRTHKTQLIMLSYMHCMLHLT